jgi:hypothetical protein
MHRDRWFMQLLEFARKRGLIFKKVQSGLGVVFGPDSEDALEAELPAFKKAVIDWADTRGADARFLTVTIVGPDALRYSARKIVDALLREDPDLKPLARRLDVELNFREANDAAKFVTYAGDTFGHILPAGWAPVDDPEAREGGYIQYSRPDLDALIGVLFIRAKSSDPVEVAAGVASDAPGAVVEKKFAYDIGDVRGKPVTGGFAYAHVPGKKSHVCAAFAPHADRPVVFTLVCGRSWEPGMEAFKLVLRNTFWEITPEDLRGLEIVEARA